ncbi:hypothetical protein [Agromyces humatus]|uniref:Histidine kinase n=1 Tax=Agromyces humatus TaxID=279573 RepID=A0ABP4WAQ1_9MICO|nr:hypothetical protein [Agromyces humatus]
MNRRDDPARDDAARDEDAASGSPHPGTSARESAAGGGVRVALTVVSVLLFLEAAVVSALVVWLVIDLVSLEPSSYVTAIALIVIVVIGAIWVWAVAIASLRRAPWARAAAIVWQILQLSVAVGAFQGLFARADVGWALLVPAITVIGLLLWTPVRIAYSRPEGSPDAA